MEFKNGYNFLYQRARDIYASKIGRPGENDDQVDLGITTEELASAKLIYETKESIMASFTGVPTVEDKPIELTANGEVVVGPSGKEPRVIKPIEVGQVLRGFDFGEVKNGDINADLDTFLLSLAANEPTILVMSDAEGMGLYAMHIPSSEIQEEFAILAGLTNGGSGMPTIYYSTIEGEIDGIVLIHGYQNLDNGYGYSYPFEVAHVADNIEGWNGKLIGGMIYAQPEDKFIPVALDDEFINMHFNTALTPSHYDFKMESWGTDQFTAFLPYFNWYYNNGHSSTHYSIYAWYIKAGTEIVEGYITDIDAFGILFSNSGMYPIYADEGFAKLYRFLGIDIEAGWQGSTLKEIAVLSENTELLDPTGYGVIQKLPVSQDYNQIWNGLYMGFTQDDYYNPAPVEEMNPFEMDMLIKKVPNMHFDTSREADLLNMLQSLEYTEGPTPSSGGCELMRVYDENPDEIPGLTGYAPIAAIKDEAEGFYGLLAADWYSDSGLLAVYSNKPYTITQVISPKWTIEIVFNGGFENLDENGNSLAFETMKNNQVNPHIINIDNTGNWNGNLIGFVGDYPEE